MRLLFAYGNSDQQSFRSDDVRRVLDYVTVPATIAAYYPSATAGFILSLNKGYVIEPRTPLFQREIQEIRPSHRTLAAWLGASVTTQLGDGTRAGFPADFYTRQVVREMVETFVGMQAEYGGRAEADRDVFERYRAILAEEETTEDEALPEPENAPPPSYILSPYFAVGSTRDPWWRVMLAIWDACQQSNQASSISPVIAVTNPRVLSQVLGELPDSLAKTTFFWVTGFDERQVGVEELDLVQAAISAHGQSRELVNLYGGFFSVALERAGLWGVSSALGYSEHRNWPELGATGAGPLRYYIRQLHQFVPVRTGQALIRIAPYLACDCELCSANRGRETGLSYAELKRHFALAREWERNLVAEQSADQLAELLVAEADRFEADIRPLLPARLGLRTNHLRRWAGVIRGLTAQGSAA